MAYYIEDRYTDDCPNRYACQRYHKHGDLNLFHLCTTEKYEDRLLLNTMEEAEAWLAELERIYPQHESCGFIRYILWNWDLSAPLITEKQSMKNAKALSALSDPERIYYYA
jgi:hypothetical protein